MNDYSLFKKPISFTDQAGVVSLFVSLIIFGLNSTWALTAKPIVFKDLILSSDLIVYGTVQKQEIKSLYPNRPQMIFTLSTLKVNECWKGECGEQLMVSQIGGQKGSFTVSIPGASLLKKHGQVVVFLKKKTLSDSESTHYVIVGLNQGMYTVSTHDHHTWVNHPYAPSTPNPTSSDGHNAIHIKQDSQLQQTQFKPLHLKDFKERVLHSFTSSTPKPTHPSSHPSTSIHLP
jgi:hypothetical protein